jgi:hypothetical protein
MADAFRDNPPENFRGYALINASAGVEVTLQPLPPQPPPPGFHVFLPVVFKHAIENFENCYDAFQSPNNLNGGFETLLGYGRPASWATSSANNYPLADSTWFHDGHYGAYLGGYNDPDDQYGDVDDDLRQEQAIFIPANHSAYLTYDWYMHTEEIPRYDAWDFFYVRLRDSLGNEVDRLKAESNWGLPDTWQSHWISLSDHAGPSGLYLHFETDLDRSYPTSFFVDNVKLWVCGP